MSDTTDNKEGAPARQIQSWWDTWWALAFLVIAIFAGRAYILEPYKIPSGSMEPTLIGHEDYGDRIVTNKLAFAPAKQVFSVLGGAVLIIALGFIASKSWKSVKAIVITMALLVGVVGGIGFAWTKEAVAGQPKRFEVVVFEYEADWLNKGDKTRINYIKRLCGLPGETIIISGGDLFTRDTNGNDAIIRKWKDAPEVQEQFWYPVNRAWAPTTHRQMSDEDKRRVSFPWTGGEAGRKLGDKSLELDGSVPVELSYPYRVTNMHVRQGPWPFRHVDCPATRQEGMRDENGIVWRNPKNAPTDVVIAYVNHPSEGVQCPQCRNVIFPLEADDNKGLQPWQRDNSYYESKKKEAQEKNATLPEFTKFFYGGDDVVGDLKLEIELEVEQPGVIELQVGSDLHSALWRLGGSVPEGSETVHVVKNATALPSGRHSLSLSYLDGTVIALLDGQEIARVPIDVKPIGAKAKDMKSLARMKFDGFKGRITKLDLFRDQYYMPKMKGPEQIFVRQRASRELEDNGWTYKVTIPEGEFLMLGDNAPSSSDSRIWGTVPRANIVGRASFIWWPMSRWKTITHGHGEALEAPKEHK